MLIAALVRGLIAIGQHEVAFFLPLVAVGMPARILRNSDVRTDSPYFRLALSSGGLAMAVIGWAVGLGAIGMGLAFGMREWVAYGVIRYWPKAVHVPSRPIVDPLGFAEIARNTAVSGRRLLTYRITKIALTRVRADRQYRRADRARAQLARQDRTLSAASPERLHPDRRSRPQAALLSSRCAAASRRRWSGRRA